MLQNLLQGVYSFFGVHFWVYSHDHQRSLDGLPPAYVALSSILSTGLRS
jgi:hypothetical protein